MRINKEESSYSTTAIMPILYESTDQLLLQSPRALGSVERLYQQPVLTDQFLSMKVGEGGWRESDSFSKAGRYIKIAMTYPHQNHAMHEFEAYVAGIGWVSPAAIHSVCGEFTGSPPDYLDVRTAVKSIDRILASWWQCNEPHVGWIVFDLGSTRTVTRVRVNQGQYMDSVDVWVGEDPADFVIPIPKPVPTLAVALAAAIVIIGGVIYLKRRK